MKNEYTIGKYKIKKEWICLILVLALGTALRLVNNTPYFSSYWQDEAEYSLRSIYINEHQGAYDVDKLYDHPPLFMYAQASVFLLFGNEWFIARGLGIALGLTTMIIFYYIGKEWKNGHIGLLMASVFAVAPITVMLNREALIDNLLGLFIALIILFTLKYEKSEDNRYLFVIAILFALAFNTKHTAIILLPPYLYYFYKKDLWRRREGWVCICIIVILILPIIFLMSSHGFIALHLGKTSMTTHESWTGMHPFLLILAYHIESLATLLLRTGIALVPFYFGIKFLRKKRTLFSNLIMIWILTSVIFFLTMRVTGYHYDYNEFLPMIPIIGIGLFFSKKWVVPVFVGLIVVTVCLIPYASDQQTGALVYLEDRISENDTILALPYPEVAYHFKDKDITVLSKEDIGKINASWVVATRRRINGLEKSGIEVNEYLEAYTPVFESKYDYYIGFLIYQRK